MLQGYPEHLLMPVPSDSCMFPLAPSFFGAMRGGTTDARVQKHPADGATFRARLSPETACMSAEDLTAEEVERLRTG